jgi:hypothetical protein
MRWVEGKRTEPAGTGRAAGIRKKWNEDRKPEGFAALRDPKAALICDVTHVARVKA